MCEFRSIWICIFLEVQNKTYSEILYLINYIAYGPKFQHKNRNPPQIGSNPKKSRLTNKNPVCVYVFVVVLVSEFVFVLPDMTD